MKKLLLAPLFLVLLTACPKEEPGDPEPELELCAGGIDEDGDSLVDCADPDCAEHALCRDHVELCDNLTDDDGDFMVDCDDPDCATHESCIEYHEGVCDNGADDDEDGLTDCEDSDCQETDYCLDTFCSRRNLFFDSENRCEEGECRLLDDFSIGCTSEGTPPVDHYEPCTSSSSCPFGDVCVGEGDQRVCTPLCLYGDTVHGGCPGGGTCWYALQGTHFSLCVSLSGCDLLDESCPAGLACYPTEEGSNCFLTGVLENGASCLSHDQCSQGSGCYLDTLLGITVCAAHCDLTLEVDACDTGTCSDTLDASPLGICL